MIYAAVNTGASTFPQTFLSTITQPFVQLGTAISTFVEGTIDKFVNADKYKAENEALRAELSELYNKIMDKDSIDAENKQLREMLEIAKQNDDYVWSPPCSIIARNANDVFGGFTINRGKNDGIELHDPVFTKTGLVGIITEIAPNSSKVETLLSTNVSVGAITTKNQTVGIVENDVIYSKNGNCHMAYIPKESKIAKGDVVVTSGGVVFPDGLVIGIVERVFDDPNGLSVHAEIKPVVDVFGITDVFVITEFGNK